MGRSPCCAKEGLNRGAWTAMEDKILIDYIQIHGEGKWRHLPKRAGLKRCGKSCRLRWLNYLRPDIKRGNITRDEEDLIIRLHKLLGNRWSLIAGRLPGRTDNEIKNYWNTNIGKKLQNANSKSPTTTCLARSRSSTSLARQDSDPDPDMKTSPNTAPCVVRTRATRCTKVIVSKELQPLMAEPCSTHDTNVKCDPEKTLEEPPFVDSEGNLDNTNNNPLDFMADFEMDETFFSDLLNMDIAEPSCYENNNVAEDSNASTGDEQGCRHLSPPTSNDTHLMNNNVSDASLRGSHGSEDFQSMSALMENEFDWL